MSGLVALVGGHEHTPGCEPLDRRLLRASGVRTPEVAVLLGASPQRRRAFKQAEAERWWAGLGARARCAFAGESDPAERATMLLAEADLVVLTGGRPWLLRERLRTTGVDRLVRARAAAGVPLAGSSAGAMALAGWAWSLQAPSPFALVPALGTVPGVLVAPHAGRHGVDGRAAVTQRRHPDVEVLLVADRTGVLVDATGDRTVIGPGTASSLWAAGSTVEVAMSTGATGSTGSMGSTASLPLPSAPLPRRAEPESTPAVEVERRQRAHPRGTTTKPEEASHADHRRPRPDQALRVDARRRRSFVHR